MNPIRCKHRIDSHQSAVILLSSAAVDGRSEDTMATTRWDPKLEMSKQEEFLLKRCKTVKKLFGFLRLHRHEIFSDKFQEELAEMYRDTGAGLTPVPPALLAMAALLQGYAQSSDAETVELTVVDLRWQLVLGCLGATEAAFAQGTFQEFRQRMIKFDMDRRLLERTIEVAKKSKGFDWKKLPKTLRVGMDSRPLEGAGRVEDTINLLGHAARKIAECAAELTERSVVEVCRAARCPLLLAVSVKAGLDADWSDPAQKAKALQTLHAQVEALHDWVEKKMPQECTEGPLSKYLEALVQVEQQDLEKTKNGAMQIRQGVAPDRRVSIEDAQMRHGRKSKSKKYNGYKEHVAGRMGTGLILACAVTPANVPDSVGGEQLKQDVERTGQPIDELHVDRAYLNGTAVDEVLERDGEVLSKPWPQRNSKKGLFTKADFEIDLKKQTITCPAGEVEQFELGETVQFDPEVCGACPLRAKCTHSASGKGRSVNIAEDEELQKKLRRLQQTPSGRARLRERVEIEHDQARIAQRKGKRARYVGARNNLFDLRRVAAVQNLEVVHRAEAA